jgi:predicted RNA-binding protein with PIN domain
MILLIDAYNLLKQIFGPEVSEQECLTYIKNLNTYSSIKHHKIIIIFDGGFFEYSTKEKQGNITRIDAGRGRTADEMIMEYIATHKTQEMVLVSSDRELGRYASNHGIIAIDSIFFNYFVQQAIKKPEKLIAINHKVQKLHPEDHNEKLDALMHEASHNVTHKPEDIVSTSKHSPRSRLSKRDRTIMMKLKKL